MSEPRVVIVGAGFGGLSAARTLRNAPVRVIVVDRRNHHLFQPLLYQVATAALSPGDIAAPIRHVLRAQRNAEVILEDALEIRRRIFTAFERAEREPAPAARRALLTFVVVGAGPTGVELAGALAEIARYTLSADFRHISPENARVVLLEAAPRVLPAYPERLSEAARRQLERIGVEVRTGAQVTGIDAAGVDVAGERIESRTVLWGAGVAASPLAGSLGAPLDRSGRVEVRPDLSIPGHPEVFVAGDLA